MRDNRSTPQNYLTYKMGSKVLNKIFPVSQFMGFFNPLDEVLG